MKTQEAEYPTAQYTADNTDDQVNYNSEASATHDLTGNKTGYDPDKNIPNYTHNT